MIFKFAQVLMDVNFVSQLFLFILLLNIPNKYLKIFLFIFFLLKMIYECVFSYLILYTIIFVYYLFMKSKNSFYYLINQLSQNNFNENLIYTTELTQLYILEYNLFFFMYKDSYLTVTLFFPLNLSIITITCNHFLTVHHIFIWFQANHYQRRSLNFTNLIIDQAYILFGIDTINLIDKIYN